MDEIAHATGKDPVEMRLALLDGAGANAGGDKPTDVGGAKRLANALRTAVGRSGYGAIKLGPHEGIGVACVSSQERATPTWTACVAHVKVAPDTGEITLKKLTVAMDVGTAVNPDGVRAQIEGSTLWGASIALYEKATMKDGGIEQTNFDGYTPMRMSQMPELDISIIANGEAAVGCGEPGVTRGRTGDRQRHLQRGRGAGAHLADHGGGGEGGDEGLIAHMAFSRSREKDRSDGHVVRLDAPLADPAPSRL